MRPHPISQKWAVPPGFAVGGRCAPLFTDISRSDKVPVTYEIDLSGGFAFNKGEKIYQYKGWKELLGEILAYEESEAKVPSYITTAGPNDLIEILGR